ncbi:MAG: phosphatidylserine decarboxylase [SAR324 cluster bacterium]|uniref:phosphatidylserine decarboxylase n=1 Tax=SAR324 cluster bacterium TaxID=2024889 RepID=A0A7X9FTV9_9DELT|nr:phosphatidylserine decarboxylase [SAR324 cluster bacterium]
MKIGYYLFKLFPKKLFSYLFGKLMHIELPRFLHMPLLKTFVWAYKIDSQEAEAPLSHYKSLGAFFVRELKDKSRPLGASPFSPVDGVLRDLGIISQGQLPQIKGESYSVEKLLQDSNSARRFEEGLFFNFYLSPRDYHHVHYPQSGAVVSSRYIPGHLWPVNRWSLKNVEGVFAQNERVVTYLETEFGLIAVVMVAAFNVGRISVSYDTFETNQIFQFRSPKGFSAVYNPPKEVRAGERLGTFHLGSSVVILIEASSSLCKREFGIQAPANVFYGQSLFS